MSEREKLIEVMARAMHAWGSNPDHQWETDGPHVRARFVGYAKAALTALEAAGVRLVPVQADVWMKMAAQALGDLSEDGVTASDIYTTMLAASPYAPEGT